MTKQQYTEHDIRQSGKEKAVAPGAINGLKQKLKTYSLDLRIHSPVALGHFGMDGVDTLPALVRLAKNKGLDLITVTDFYNTETVDKIKKAAEGSGLVIIPGVDIRAAIPECNDVQLTCIFPEVFTSVEIGAFLESLRVPESAKGRRDYIVALDIEEILKLVEQHGGACFPSRMDKTPARMGAIPALVEKHGIRAFDLAYQDSNRFFQTRWPKEKFHLFSFSNANALAQVGSRSARVKLDQPCFESLSLLVQRKK
jgi:3',5'-nucleoside bisphosphate phosphatase